MRAFDTNWYRFTIVAPLVLLAHLPNGVNAEPSPDASPSVILPFPEGALDPGKTKEFLKEQWKVEGNVPQVVEFTFDPAGHDNTALRVTYNSGTWNNGGANFFVPFSNDTSQGSPTGLMLSYEIFFSENFQFVKGGKLPGPRGGAKANSCSGGRQPDGTDCFTARLMWRKEGAGEVYAYIPRQESLCTKEDVECNSDFGFSIGRGKFNFVTGKWQSIDVFVQMNDPPSEANGVVAVYYNGELAIERTDLVYRTSEEVAPTGMFFSTFFGGTSRVFLIQSILSVSPVLRPYTCDDYSPYLQPGGDSSWATPQTVHTFYRNFQMRIGSGLKPNGEQTGGNNDDPGNDDDDDLEDC